MTEELLERLTVTPPEGAGSTNWTVHEVDAPNISPVGLHASDDTSGGVGVMGACTKPPVAVKGIIEPPGSDATGWEI
jgi:hypothetical protein